MVVQRWRRQIGLLGMFTFNTPQHHNTNTKTAWNIIYLNIIYVIFVLYVYLKINLKGSGNNAKLSVVFFLSYKMSFVLAW